MINLTKWKILESKLLFLKEHKLYKEKVLKSSNGILNATI